MSDGSPSNTEQLYRRVFRYGLNLTRSVDLAEELSQEAFLRTQQTSPHWLEQSNSQSPEARRYLIRVVRNLWIDRMKKKSLSLDTDASVDVCPDAATPYPWHRLVTDESLRSAFELMMELPDRQREVLYLRTVEALSIEEIADSLATTRGNIKALLSIARKKLREQVTSESSTSGATKAAQG